MFPLGSQYFRPPTPEEHHWERDLATFHEHGLNITRAWAYWNWVCPTEGEYDFSQYDRVLEICHANSIKLIFLLSLEGAPSWAARKYPDSLFVDWQENKFYLDAVPNVAGGGFPGLCFHHPEALKAGLDFITAFCRHYKDREGVYGFEPINEPQMEPSRFRINTPYCYCEHSVAAFQEWMRARYKGDIKAANRAWRGSFGCFEDIQPPRVFGGYANWLHWRLFMIESFSDYVDKRSGAIRAGAPKAPLIAHSASQAMVGHNIAIELIDDWRLARLPEIYGASAFPSAQGLEGAGMGMDQARRAANGKPFWMAEIQQSSRSFGLHRLTNLRSCPVCKGAARGEMEPVDAAARARVSAQVSPELTRMWVYVSLAHGATGVMSWQFCHERYGLEHHDGLIALDGTPSTRLKELQKISPCLQQHESLFLNAKVPAPRIGILFAPQSYMMNFAALGCVHLVQNAIRGAYNALWRTNYTADFLRLDDDVVDDDYSPYKVLYLPMPVWIAESSVAKLKRFVKNGGILVSEASAAQYLPDGLTSDINPGMGLDELFGLRRKLISSHAEVRFTFEDLEIPSTFYRETLNPGTGKAIGHFVGEEGESGGIAVVENEYGKGRTIYLGSNPFMHYADSRSPAVREMVCRLNKDVDRPAWSNAADVIVRYLDSGDKGLIYIINTAPDPRTTDIYLGYDPGELSAPLGDEVPRNPPTKTAEGIWRFEPLALKPYESRLLVGRARAV